MNIKHTTITNIDKIIETYKNTEGVDVVYVCTTDIKYSDKPVDVFYREEKHPQFGNNYFGVSIDNDKIRVCNADVCTNCFFGVVENDEGMLEYSSSLSEGKTFENGNMIGGGRSKILSNGPVDIFKIKDGQMVLEVKFDEYGTFEPDTIVNNINS